MLGQPLVDAAWERWHMFNGEVGPHGHARAAAIVQQRSMPQSDIHQGYNGLSYYPPQQQNIDQMDTRP